MCCSLQGFSTHQTPVPVFIQYKQAPGQQGKLDHSQEEANKAESLDGVSEQCDDIARRFGRPGIGEIICKVTHKGLQMVTADGDCSHEIKRHLLLGRKAMTNLGSILKSRDITLPTKVCLVKAMVFPVVMYGCENWTIKKTEH